MAKKKEELSAGLANLLSGADQRVSQKQATGTPERGQDVADEAAHGQGQPEGAAPAMKVEPTTSQDEKDLLNTIEDEELRKELELRLAKKRLIGRGRPRKNDQLGRRSDGYGRTSIIIPLKKWEKVKEIAFLETLTIKEIIELALDTVIDRYEAKHGEVKPQPDRKRDINEIF